MIKPVDFDSYKVLFPEGVQSRLDQVRETIRQAAPEAEEVISYAMPAFKLNGIVVWFGAHRNHIGFYPRVSGMEAFKQQLSVYKSAKGSVQFPLDQPLPVDLIAEIVRFRVAENLEEAKARRK